MVRISGSPSASRCQGASRPELPSVSETAMAATDAAATVQTRALFTEAQARTHLRHLGYADISGLTRDENGVWHGTATKDGEQRNVAVDIRGMR